MKIYNIATDVIKQGGARRGANMGILRIDHPDILDFIRIKRTGGELTNFNISVSVTDAFMDTLKNEGEYELVNPRSEMVAGKIKAHDVFKEIVESAWETGDPGLIFIDRINRDNPTPNIGSIESTNPCGEQPLLPYEACILGSLNLSRYIKQSAIHGSKLKSKDVRQQIDFDGLSKDIKTAVRFLDNSIDVNKYPLPAIEAMHKGNRKIGLGVMGWADMLILMGLPYNHKKAFELGEMIMKFMRDESKNASAELARERGVFPNFKGSVYDAPDMPCVRNATTTTIAPTGTLSMVADCSSGIEPLFALAYKKLVLDTELFEINRYFFDIARERGFYSEALKEQVINRGSLHGIKEIPNDVRRLFKTAHEIPFEDHIEMQACFQKFTDNAVSKTINMPHKARREDVERAFMLAYDKGCKGITVFRYGTQKKGTLVRAADTG
jgi:ribonucleoside-diphosphate reductase alpha chain